MRIRNVPERLFLQWYEEILVSCRAIAVSLDPLFFYVPVIKEDKKCIELNKVLWIIAIVSRSVTDFIYLVHFVVKFKIRNERNVDYELNTVRVKGRSKNSWSNFMLNILVILPIPQVRETFIYFLLPSRAYKHCYHNRTRAVCSTGLSGKARLGFFNWVREVYNNMLFWKNTSNAKINFFQLTFCIYVILFIVLKHKHLKKCKRKKFKVFEIQLESN